MRLEIAGKIGNAGDRAGGTLRTVAAG